MIILCETCKTRAPKGVACVPCVPLSVAYCQECLDNNAHPFWVLKASVAINGGPVHTAAWFLDKMNTFVDGGYMTLRAALEKYPLGPEDINPATPEEMKNYSDLAGQDSFEMLTPEEENDSTDD